MINTPTIEEIDRIITMLEKNLATWKGKPDYARTIEVELWCAAVGRVMAQEKMETDVKERFFASTIQPPVDGATITPLVPRQAPPTGETVMIAAAVTNGECK